MTVFADNTMSRSGNGTLPPGYEHSSSDAEKYADELQALWGCPEQIEAHMESEGFSETEISEQLQRLGFNRVYVRVAA